MSAVMAGDMTLAQAGSACRQLASGLPRPDQFVWLVDLCSTDLS